MQGHHQKPNTSTGRPLVLVTGASTGIGLELARVFADNGFDLIITAEDDKLAAAEASLAGNGAKVRTVRGRPVDLRWGRAALVGRDGRRPAP